MTKRILLAVFAVALIATPALAAVQSVRVGAEVDSTYLYRRGFDFDNSSASPLYQSLFITQTTVQIDGDLTEKVAATVGLINERVWTSEQTSASTDIDLYLAYITLKEILDSPLTLIIGKQDFRYGNSFIFDTAGTNNVAPGDSGLRAIANDLTKQTTLDAVRAILDYNPLTVDLVFAVIAPGSTSLSDHETQHYLYGTNANYQLGDDMDSEVEAYFWYKVNRGAAAYEVGRSGDEDVIKVVGIRGSTNPIEGLNLQAEFAYQGGKKVTDVAAAAADYVRQRKAYAIQGIVNYQLPVLKEYKPLAQYVYTKVTGDTDLDNAGQTNEEYTGWDPFFESQGGGTIYNTLFDLTNAHIHSAMLQATPMEDVTTKLTLTTIFLEAPLHVGQAIALRQPDDTGSAAETFSVVKHKSSHLGKEVDFELLYDYTEDVQFGLNMGWFFPGALFRPSGTDHATAAKQVLVNVDVAF